MNTNPTTDEPGTNEAPVHSERGHVWAMRALVALAAVLLTLGGVAVWVQRVVLQNSTWTDTSSRVLANPQVQTALSTYLVDQLYDNVDIAGEIRGALPPRAQPLAAPAAAGLRNVITEGTQRTLASPRAAALWRQANQRAQRQLVQLLDGGSSALQTSNGTVALNLHPLLERIAGRTGRQLPADAGRIVLLRSDELKLAQDATKVLRAIALILIPIVVLILALAVWVGPDRRRAVRAASIGLLISGLVLVFLRRVVGDAAIDRLVKDETVRPAAHEVWRIATEPLRVGTISILFVGLVGLVGAWFAGPGRRATSLRRASAPYLVHDRAWLGLGAVILLLLAWGPTPAARNWITVFILLVLAIVGFEALRRLVAHEFPEAKSEPVSFSIPTDWRGGGAPAASDEDLRLDRLGKLGELHTSGVLSDAEFAREKERLLAGQAANTSQPAQAPATS